MKSTNTSLKLNSSLFVFISILVQLASIPLVYAIFGSMEFIVEESSSSSGLDFYFLMITPVIYAIIFSVIIVTSIQETTKSELLASVMNVVWILFIYSETDGALRYRPYEYILFLLCITLTIPVRIGFRKLYHI